MKVVERLKTVPDGGSLDTWQVKAWTWTGPVAAKDIIRTVGKTGVWGLDGSNI